LINRIRGLLAEFGLVFAQSPDALHAALPDVLEDASNELPGDLRLALDRNLKHWGHLDEEMAWCEQRMLRNSRGLTPKLFRCRLAGRQRLPAASSRGPPRPSGSHRLAALAKCLPARLAADLLGRRLAGKRGLQMRRFGTHWCFAAASHRLASEGP
jgi:hypothetical protein